MDEKAAIDNVKRLSMTASSWKNWLINHAIKDGALEKLSAHSKLILPNTVWDRREIYGGRIVVIPYDNNYHNIPIETILKDAEHPLFDEVSAPVYATIGDFLNKLKGQLKATPDFGPNASTADKLHKFTNYVLGIHPSKNGSGGKSEYSIVSILTALKLFGLNREQSLKDTTITVIGSAGALGTGILEYLEEQQFSNVLLCDLQYAQHPPKNLPEGWKVTEAVAGRFTDECLQRNGKPAWLITAAYGNEMLASNWQSVPQNSIWIAAQNNDIPEKIAGLEFATKLQTAGIKHLPGQILTLGGTKASWIEWCCRSNNAPFNKEAAYESVELVTAHIIEQMNEATKQLSITPYEAMLRYADKNTWQN
jgi:glutamate dehydrogenase/leucine dehydrogenase